MKLPIKAFILMVILSLCCGCGDSETEKSDIEKNETVNFPDEIQKDVSKQITVNAKCIYPENCKTGTGLKAKLGEGLFWDKQDEIVDLVFENKTIEQEYSNDYGGSQD
jgi:hypothetical protein